MAHRQQLLIQDGEFQIKRPFSSSGDLTQLKLTRNEDSRTSLPFPGLTLVELPQEDKVANLLKSLNRKPEKPKLLIKKAQSALIPVKQSQSEQITNQIVDFFIHNSHINLKNFAQAQSLFFKLFAAEADFNKAYLVLAQALDKRTDKIQRNGKAILNLKPGQRLCLERSSVAEGYVKQHLSFDLARKEMLSYTSWNEKSKGTELIRASRKLTADMKVKSSLKFDTAVWKKFNARGLNPKNYLKALDCIERNHLQLDRFISLANSKSIYALFEASLIHNAKIRTNNRNTTYLDFTTPSKQSIQFKITAQASSLLVINQ